MTSESGTEALRRHAAERSQAKAEAVVDAVAALRARGASLTISGVAREAGVSREFIHSHADLHSAILTAAQDALTTPTRADAGASERSLRADKQVLIARVARDKVRIAELEAKVTELKNQRRRWLGAQLDQTEGPTQEAHTELRISHERLAADNASLRSQVRELERLVGQLEGDLAASRQAHAEDVHRLLPRNGNVVPFGNTP